MEPSEVPVADAGSAATDIDGAQPAPSTSDASSAPESGAPPDAGTEPTAMEASAPDAPPPSNGIADPLNLHVKDSSPIQATLAWTEPTGGPFEAVVTYAPGAPPADCNPSASNPYVFSAGAAGATETQIMGLSPGTAYGARVCYRNPTPSAALPYAYSLGATVSFTTPTYAALPDPHSFSTSSITKTTANVSWEYSGSTNQNQPDAFNGFAVAYAPGAPPSSCSSASYFGAPPYQGKYTIGLSSLTPGTTYGVRICTRRGTPLGVVLSGGLTGSVTTTGTADAGADAAGADAAADSGTVLPPKPTFANCNVTDIAVRWTGTAPLYRVVEKQTPLDSTCGSGGVVVVDVAGNNEHLVQSTQSVVLYVCGYDGVNESAPLKVDVKIPIVPGSGTATCDVL